MREAAGGEAFERAAHLRDAVRTIETLRDRRNKMEAPGMGDRDAFGVKVGPAGGGRAGRFRCAAAASCDRDGAASTERPRD